MKYVQYFTFLLHGNNEIRVTSSPDAAWDLYAVQLLTKISKEKKLCELLSYEVKPNGQTGKQEVVLKYTRRNPSFQRTNRQLVPSSSVVFFLSDSDSVVQVTFATNINSQLQITSVNPLQTIFTENNFENRLMAEMPRVLKSQKPLMTLGFLLSSFFGEDYFENNYRVVPDNIKAIIMFALRKMKDTMLLQLIEFVRYIDFKLQIGMVFDTGVANLFLLVIQTFPEMVSEITPFCLQTCQPLCFTALILKVSIVHNIFARAYCVNQVQNRNAIWLNMIAAINYKLPIDQSVNSIFKIIIPNEQSNFLLYNYVYQVNMDIISQLNSPKARPLMIDENSINSYSYQAKNPELSIDKIPDIPIKKCPIKLIVKKESEYELVSFARLKLKISPPFTIECILPEPKKPILPKMSIDYWIVMILAIISLSVIMFLLQFTNYIY